MSKSLYELTAEFSDLAYLLEQEDADEAEITAKLEEVEKDIDTKADGYARIVRNWAAEAEGLASEIDRLTKRRKAVESAAERLKRYLQNAMLMTGKTAIATSIGKWSIRNNPPSAVITDFAKIPERYLIPQEPKVNNRQIIADFKENGEIIPGVEVVRKQSLSFR